MWVGGREKRGRMRKTSKARKEAKDVVGRANSRQQRALPLFGPFFTASSRPGRVAPHISAAGKTPTASVSTLVTSQPKRQAVSGEDGGQHEPLHVDELSHIISRTVTVGRKPTGAKKDSNGKFCLLSWSVKLDVTLTFDLDVWSNKQTTPAT